MLASDILLPDGLLGCHTGAVKKKEKSNVSEMSSFCFKLAPTCI